MNAFDSPVAPVDATEVAPDVGFDPEVPDIERDFVDVVATQDRLAKDASRPWRAEMQSNLQMFFSEVMSATEPVELGTWYVNAVGRRIEMYVDSLHERVFPDPINYANFHVVLDEPSTRLDDPNLRIDQLLMNRAVARLGEMSLSQSLRRGLRSVNAQQFFRLLMLDRAIMGNCYHGADYEEVLTSGGQPQFGADDYLPTEGEYKVEGCGIKTVRVDPRNFFPGSIEQDGGVEALEWWTEYDVITYDELLRGRRVDIGGQQYGRYHNWERLDPRTAQYVSRIYYDDLNDGSMTEPIMLPVIADPDLEKGWRVCRRIGQFGLRTMRLFGKDYTKAEWIKFVERMTEKPYDDVKDAIYWQAVIAYPANSQSCGGGVLLEFGPHWLKNGGKCPRVQSRLKFHPGQFFGDSFYKTCTGDEALLNIILRTMVWNNLYGAKPAAIFDQTAIDSQYLAQNDGMVRLIPGSLIPARMASIPGQKVMDFVQPSMTSNAEAMNAIGVFTQNIDQTTRQTALNFGEISDRATATNIAAVQSNSEVPVRADATACDTGMVMPWLAMVLEACIQISKQNGAAVDIGSYAEAEALRGTSGALDAVLDSVESGGVERRQVEGLFPVKINVPEGVFDNKFTMTALINSSAGGRIGYLTALDQFYQRSVALQPIYPNQVDLMGLNVEIARQGGVTKPEQWLNQPEGVDKAMELQAAAAMVAGAQAGGVVAGKGTPSPPKEPGGFDPGAAAQGVVSA